MSCPYLPFFILRGEQPQQEAANEKAEKNKYWQKRLTLDEG